MAVTTSSRDHDAWGHEYTEFSTQLSKVGGGSKDAPADQGYSTLRGEDVGRHSSGEPDAPTEPMIGAQAPGSESLLPPWVLMGSVIAIAAIALVGVVIVLATASVRHSSYSDVPAPSERTVAPGPPVSADQRYEWAEQYATPGWATEENQAHFGRAMNTYLRQLDRPSRPATLSGAGISDCIVLRASRPDQLESASTDPGTLDTTTAYAILNAAIDVYCPEQSAYRGALAP